MCRDSYQFPKVHHHISTSSRYRLEGVSNTAKDTATNTHGRSLDQSGLSRRYRMMDQSSQEDIGNCPTSPSKTNWTECSTCRYRLMRTGHCKYLAHISQDLGLQSQARILTQNCVHTCPDGFREVTGFGYRTP